MNGLPKWNCASSVCTDNLKALVVCFDSCPVIPTQSYTVDAGQKIDHGSPVAQGALPTSVKAWVSGDVAIGIADCSADTRPAPDGQPNCDDLCVIVRGARLYRNGLSWPVGTTDAQKAPVYLALEAKNIWFTQV